MLTSKVMVFSHSSSGQTRLRVLITALLAVVSVAVFAARSTSVSAAGYPVDNDWEGVAYGNGTFVAVSSTGSGNRVMTSTDGITWTSRASASDSNWQAVTYGNGLFVAVGTNAVMTSTDGISWTSRTAVNGSWDSVAGCGNMFVAVSSVTSPYVMSSPDGITWTQRTPAFGWDHQQVACRESPLVFVSSSHLGRVWYSLDGITWSQGSQGHIVHIHAKAFGSVSGTGTFSWLEYNDYDNNQSSGSISTNGTSFTSTGGNAVVNGWNSMTFGNGKFVAVAQSGSNTRAAYSTNGSTWTLGSGIPANSWESVTYGNGTFVAVAKTGTGNRVATSTDGINWSAQSLVVTTTTTAPPVTTTTTSTTIPSTTTVVATSTTIPAVTTTLAIIPSGGGSTGSTIVSPVTTVKTATTIVKSSATETTVAPTTTVTPTTTTTIPVPPAPEAPPGKAGATVDGKVVTTKLSRLDNSIVVEAGGIKVDVYAVDNDAVRIPLNDQGVLEISGADTIVLDGEGYEPGSEVDVWLHSTPLKLGTVMADGEGRVSGQYVVPASVDAGDHRVVLAGRTKSGGDSVIGVGLRIGSYGKESNVNRWIIISAIILAVSLALILPTTARRRRRAG